MSKFLGAQVNLGTAEAATVTLATSLLGAVLEACTTGSVGGLGQTAEVAGDIAQQAVRHPGHYRVPKL